MMRQQQISEAASREVIDLLYEAAAASEGWTDALDRLYPLVRFNGGPISSYGQTASDQPVASLASTTYLGQKEALEYYLRIDAPEVDRPSAGWGDTIVS